MDTAKTVNPHSAWVLAQSTCKPRAQLSLCQPAQYEDVITKQMKAMGTAKTMNPHTVRGCQHKAWVSVGTAMTL